ncbi:MAG: flagellar basal body P-ring formation chaperone FlgA [Vibrio sp.]
MTLSHARSEQQSTSSLSNLNATLTSAEQIKQFVSQRIENSLQTRFPHAKNPVINIRLPSGIKSIPVCEEDLIAEEKDNSFIGQESWRIRCEKPRLGSSWSTKVVSSTQIEVQAVLSAKPLKKGHRIEEGDVKLEWLTLSRNTDIFQNTSALIGRKLRRSIADARPLSNRYVELDYDVHSGHQVYILYKTGTISIETTGIALGDGMVGDTIQVENEGSGKRFPVEVTGKNRVRGF